MKKIISTILASLAMVSCVDTVLLPDDKTVDQDFWKTKADVNQMVQGAYHSMLTSDVLTRLIVWGDFRSDELNMVSSISADATVNALTEIDAVNIQTTNAFATWGGLYSVINNCNIVLDRAKAVMDLDPSYTEGDFLTDRSQMLALRSLCYFYLVRNFRDVPYSAKAYMNSSEEMNIGQLPPDSVLHNCIRDLEEAAGSALDPTAFSDWRRVGWINKDGINAILADIYLWLGSVHHDAGYYAKCVEYCDKVITSKQEQHVPDRGEVELNEYPLADYETAFSKLYVRQNAEESIFELQLDGTSNSNTGLCQMFFKYAKDNSPSGYTKAPSMFAKAGSGQPVYIQASDMRYINNVYAPTSNVESFDIRKFTTINGTISSNPVGNAGEPRSTSESRTYTKFAQNYIFYRLSDVMLMKAEAQVQLAQSDDDVQLRQAFNLVQAVNSRSIYKSSLSTDSLKFSFYKTRTNVETLILQERLRELCFEGKRWYDLMRYNYRQIEPADYGKTLYQLNEEGKEFARNSTAFLNLVTRKYTSGANAAAAKMRTEPYLYMPINQSDIDVNANLRQNPVYKADDEYKKNY